MHVRQSFYLESCLLLFPRVYLMVCCSEISVCNTSNLRVFRMILTNKKVFSYVFGKSKLYNTFEEAAMYNPTAG